jgi:uncharacterized protein YndB with AHSA1/START domain
MTAPVHAEIVVELELPALPARVFEAYADPAQRRRWVRMPGRRDSVEQTFDLRVGATEASRSSFDIDGRVEHLDLRTTHLDIVDGERIVSSVVFRLDGVVVWVSLLTVLLVAEGPGTRLVRTEQLTVLRPTDDGSRDVAHQRGGARLQLNGLLALIRDDAGTAT